MAKLSKKQLWKRAAGKCRCCGDDALEALDVHRILAGSAGGKYREQNVAVLCSRCHRLEQAGKIVIEGWYHSTGGNLLHWYDESGAEHFS